MLEHTNDGEKFLLVHRVVEFGTSELLRFESHRSSSLKGRPIRQNSTRAVVTSIARYKNLVVAHVLVINNSQALTTDNQLLDCVESFRVFSCPRKTEFRLFRGKRIQSRSVLREGGEEIRDVPYKTQESASICSVPRSRPVQDAMDLSAVSLYTSLRDVMT